MIPDDVINQIRDAVDIVAVIGQHVQLKKAGTSWKGLCPFHGEKTPSFNVSPLKKRFHCFGCQKGGDAIGFLMELEGKSFVEVAEQLAARYNIEVPKIEESPEARRARGERLAMLDLNKIATAFFRETLAHPERGKAGREYLEKRAVAQDITDRFQLGYAPAEWGALADHLIAKKCDMQLAVRLGLVAPRPRTAGYYDRFRDRLVCPVMVPGGDIVGFSARIVGKPQPAQDGSEPPKYINSPESTVYKKSKLLFGLAQAREGMTQHKRAVLVEGNFDVISLHQAGFTEVIAPLGTALTIEQIHQLRRLTEKIVLLYDGDRAGYKATMHALTMCVEAEVEVLVAWRPGNAKSGGSGQLTDGVDPDSLIAAGGAEQLRSALDNAKGGIDFFAYEVWGRARGNSDARARALEEAAKLVAKVATPVKRDLIVATLATALQVDVGVVEREVSRHRSPGSSMQHRPSPPHHPNHPGDRREPPAPAPAKVVEPPLDEVEVITLLMDHPDLIASSEADRAFWLLTDEKLRAMYSAARAGQSMSELVSTLHPKTVPLVLSGKYVDAKDPRATLAGMVRDFEVRKKTVERLQELLETAKQSGDRAQIARLSAVISSSNRKQVD